MSEPRQFKKLMALLLGLAVVVLLYGRIPGLSNQFCDPDLAGISYGAGDLLRGGVIYENCVETKPPGAYLIFASCFTLFGHYLTPVYILAALLHLLCLLALARMAHRAGGPAAAVAAAWFYAALAIDSLAVANCPNYESWMSFFIVFGLYAVSPGEKPARGRWLFIAGALLGVALLMKQQAALFLVIAAVWAATKYRGGQWSAVWRDLGLLGLGFALPFVLIAIAWQWMGGLGAMLADLDPRRLQGYVAAGRPPEAFAMMKQRFAEHLQGAWPAWLCMAGGLVFFLFRRKGRREFVRALLYLAVAVLAVVAGSRFYKHYMILLAAPLSLCAALFFGQLERALAPRRWRFAIYLLALVACLSTIRPEMKQSTMSLFAGLRGEGLVTFDMVTEFTRDDLNLENRFDDVDNRHLGLYLDGESLPGEGLYVFPYEPQIYFWARRRSPTKHYMYFEVVANLPYKLGGWHAYVNQQVRRSRRQLIADLEAAPPRFIVFPPKHCGPVCPFGELNDWVQMRYRLDAKSPSERFRVYRLLDPEK